MRPTRPLLRYHGGKWELAPWIISQFPSHRIYTEVFGGAGSVLLRKPRSYAEIYNDLDSEIVNLFRVVRERGDDLIQLLRLTPFARAEFIESYEPSPNPMEQARRTVIRSFMGFAPSFVTKGRSNGPSTGFRANSNRLGTTPATDWRNLPDALCPIIERLRGVIIENRNAIEILKQHDSPQTLHYVDPPYLSATRDAGSDYRFEMGDDDHKALAIVLNGLMGSVIVSGYPSVLYDELFSGWQRLEKDSYANGASPRKEVLWLKNIEHDLFRVPPLLPAN